MLSKFSPLQLVKNLNFFEKFKDGVQGNILEKEFSKNLPGSIFLCECFGAYGTRSRDVHVAGFGGGPKFEANVHRLNP